ncbi:MAG TPA: hypothetical protein VGK94_13540 [Candidatus Polarisedimenticolia bacterium]
MRRIALIMLACLPAASARSRSRWTATTEEARPLWEGAQQMIARDQAVTFLFEQDRLYAVSHRLQDVEPGPLGILGTLRKWRVGPPPTAGPGPRP